MTSLKIITVILGLSLTILACAKTQANSETYVWQNITPAANYPQGYNYPVFVKDGKMWALTKGGWVSEDGVNWTQTNLPESGLNSAFQKYVQFNGAVYALGTMQGNSEKMTLSSRIARTKDFKTWEVLAAESNLPLRVFYGTVVFKNKIWLFGGVYENRQFNDIWNSADGVHWEKVVSQTPWEKQENLKAVVFQDKLFLIGDAQVWSSADGKHWTLETEKMGAHPIFISGYSVAVFDEKIWLVGINRNATFQSGVLFSTDGKNWQEMKTPWSPRGAVAVWVFDNKMFLTGGKYSYTENGEIKFVYSNDVWAMSKKKE